MCKKNNFFVGNNFFHKVGIPENKILLTFPVNDQKFLIAAVDQNIYLWDKIRFS